MNFREFIRLDELDRIKAPSISKVKSPTGHRASPKGMPKPANLGVNTEFRKFKGVNIFGQPDFKPKSGVTNPNK
jgi:hypothetical protein